LLEFFGTPVADTFAEAFGMTGTRLIITAANSRWARIAATEFCGYASSVIGCDAEAAIERELSDEETPDGRSGVSVLAFAFNRDALSKAVTNRVGQTILTCPTTACFDGLPDGNPEKRIALGEQLRFFGDGYQISKRIGDRRIWRIPVMDGEFLCDHQIGTQTGVAGGNLILCATDGVSALAAAEAAAAAISQVHDVILPFPGGLVRSGSKVGSKYKALKASTNDAFCPTLQGIVKSDLPTGCGAVYELVIDGLSFEAVQNAMREGLHAAAKSPGMLLITAGNYGGKLGKHHLHLRDLVDATT
jgi:formylmethanofuran--tetrahydromethanopterin N-formyltransferase